MDNQRRGDPTDEELLDLAEAGEARAFEILMERYKQEAYRIAFDFTRDREEAKDLSQEAFLRVYRNIDRFRHKSSFHTWFYRILVNLCLDYRRRKSRIVWESLEEREAAHGHEIVDFGTGPESDSIRNEISRQLEATVAALPPKQRVAFLLNKHEGLSIQEVARKTKTAEGAVRVNIHRAITTLRASISKMVSGDVR
jgi:RNA polymerase sigma-70 factor (ECF subfamily)